MQSVIERKTMPSIGANKAKANLTQLLDRAVKGEIITITRHGVPVAELHPVESKQTNRHDVISQLKRFRQKNRLNGLSLRDLIEEGRD